MTALLSFVLLANTLFVIGEIKVFLAYMSVFHATYMISNVLLNYYNSLATSLAYLFIYLILMLHIFTLILGLRGKNLRFLTDFQDLSSLSGFNFSFICALGAMSGIPPLLGFWAKISVVAALLTRREYFLFVVALACGLYLMYFYLQNYRFNIEMIREFSYDYFFSVSSTSFFYFIACFGPFINIIACFIINDL